MFADGLTNHRAAAAPLCHPHLWSDVFNCCVGWTSPPSDRRAAHSSSHVSLDGTATRRYCGVRSKCPLVSYRSRNLRTDSVGFPFHRSAQCLITIIRQLLLIIINCMCRNNIIIFYNRRFRKYDCRMRFFSISPVVRVGTRRVVGLVSIDFRSFGEHRLQYRHATKSAPMDTGRVHGNEKYSLSSAERLLFYWSPLMFSSTASTGSPFTTSEQYVSTYNQCQIKLFLIIILHSTYLFILAR